MNSSMLGFLTLESMLGSVSSLEIAPFIVRTNTSIGFDSFDGCSKGQVAQVLPEVRDLLLYDSMIYLYNLQLSEMIEIAPIELPHMDRGRGSSTHPSGTGDGTGPPADPQPGLCPQGQALRTRRHCLAAIFVG